MEDAYGIGITNRYEFLLDTEANDPQAILKEKAKKAKKAAKKNAGKENNAKVDIKADKLIEEKKVKFVVPGKRGKQLQQDQQQQPQKSRSMKDTQNIQQNGNSENGFKETKNNFERDRNTRNNRNYENREPRFNRRNNQGNTESSMENAGNGISQENGFGNRSYRTSQENGYGNRGQRASQENGFGNRGFGNRTYNGNRNTEIGNNGQDIEYNQNYNNQNERDDDRPPRRQGNDRNFGNKRFDGQRRNFEGRVGKREYDRQSGSDKTGVKAVEKREGGGAHNWGTHKQDMEDLNKISDTEPKDDVNSDLNTKPEETLVVEEVLLTFDEYKKQQGERAKPVFNTRKAGEGEDKRKWKNLVPLKKKKDEMKSEDEYEYDPSQYPQRKRNIKIVTDIQVRFNEGKRPGFNNNRRKHNLPLRDEGRKSDDNRQTAPQVDDFRNFPSLG